MSVCKTVPIVYSGTYHIMYYNRSNQGGSEGRPRKFGPQWHRHDADHQSEVFGAHEMCIRDRCMSSKNTLL